MYDMGLVLFKEEVSCVGDDNSEHMTDHMTLMSMLSGDIKFSGDSS